jgi:NACalpha-BTF3-like transcription factor
VECPWQVNHPIVNIFKNSNKDKTFYISHTKNKEKSKKNEAWIQTKRNIRNKTINIIVEIKTTTKINGQ